MRSRTGIAATAMILLVAACGNAGSSKSSNTQAPPVSGGPQTTVSAADLTKNVPVHAPGVTSSEIKVASITSKTNNLTGSYAPLVDGIKAYFAMVNSTGGIYGRKLVVAYDHDDQFGQNRQTVQQSLSQDSAFATFIATTLFTGADLLARAKQPVFMWNINPEFAGHPTFFANEGALCFTCPGHGAPALAKELGATKVGVLAYGIAQQSKDCAQGIKSSFDTYPTATVAYYDTSLGYAQPLTAQVTQMKEKGVQLVLTCFDLQESFTLGKEMQKQGMHAVQQLPNGYDADFVKQNGAALQGSIVSPQFTALENEPQIPEIKSLYEWAGKTGVQVRELTAVGWQLAAELYEGLKGVGPNFSQAGVVSYLNTLTHWTDNGFIQPLDWTKYHQDPTNNPAVRPALQCGNSVEVENGTFVPVFGKPGKPWVCFNANDPTVNNPQYVSFVGT
jgi:ABC-type branched-subunit amino acid transport system substrate-binding protein